MWLWFLLIFFGVFKWVFWVFEFLNEKLELKRFNGETVFFRVARRKHFFVKFNGFGVSLDRLNGLHRVYPGVSKVVVLFDVEEPAVFSSWIGSWSRFGKVFDNYGDKQLVLGLEHMVREAVVVKAAGK